VTTNDRLKDAYIIAMEWNEHSLERTLADALRDTLARALRAEHMLVHDNEQLWASCYAKELQCNWTPTQWQAEADRQLRGNQ
jgi:hypothetical protein